MSDNRTLKLLEAFSGVEEDLLERCENAVVYADKGAREKATKVGAQGNVISLADRLKRNLGKNSWRYGSAIAAVFCVVIVGLACLGDLRVGMNDSAAYEAVMDEMSGGTAVPENGTASDGAMQEAASATVTYHATVESIETESATGQTAGGSGNSLESVNGITSGQTTDGIATEKVQQDVTGNGGEKSAATEEADDINVPKQESVLIYQETEEGCKEFAYVAVTEAEARAHKLFGSYVPTKLPDGYVLEGVYVSGEGEDSLMVSWSRGMDSIMVNITLPTEIPATVDVKKTETYDEYMYEIPHAETVPEDYREVFNNPVCAWEDFCLEFVQKRMIYRGGDAGDTDTPRGNFSVLYPDGVLVHFNGRGTAEEIWTLFGSMEVGK